MQLSTVPWHKAILPGVLFLALCAVALAEETAPDDKALLVVKLPAGATLTIGSSSSAQTGAERTFVSPVLPSGKEFTYKLTATWDENGQPKAVVRQALVRAGQRTVVDFNAAEPVVKAEPAPAEKPKVEATSKTNEPRTRTFLFTYAATVTGLAPGQTARVWLPVPTSSEDQDVKIESRDLPAEGKMGRERRYGNEVLYFEAKAGEDGSIPLKMTYRVTRREVKGEHGTKVEEDGELLSRLLKADAKVPVEGKPLELIKGKNLPSDEMGKARVLYDVVNGHMRYSKEGTGWGQGDAAWACDSGYGNCTDFHSLFISLARSQKIPAKFEIGFPLPEKRGAGEVPGYHCWARFRAPGKGWVPVDISEANKNPKLRDYYFGNLTEDRVTFSTGRDLELVPKQEGPPLNFFVYPYVEVDGKPYAADKVKKKFPYEDVK